MLLPGSTGIRYNMGTTSGKGFLTEIQCPECQGYTFENRYTRGFDAGGDIKYVYIFILIAVFIILLACINFTNLATARSTTRLKDVGIRKVFGVQRSKLSFQFMLESFLIVFAAYILAMVLTEISIPFFNRLTEKSCQ